MSNPLFSMLGNNINNPMLQQFRQFKSTYKGDARQQVQNMLNSGQITQQQYNNAVNMANQLQNILK